MTTPSAVVMVVTVIAIVGRDDRDDRVIVAIAEVFRGRRLVVVAVWRHSSGIPANRRPAKLVVTAKARSFGDTSHCLPGAAFKWVMLE